MKLFHPIQYSDQGGTFIGEMREAADGDYVLAEDAQQMLAALIACEDQLRGVTGALPGSDSAEICDAARAAIERATAK
jgi:hypothetical protein